jgi:hypothetical protein
MMIGISGVRSASLVEVEQDRFWRRGPLFGDVAAETGQPNLFQFIDFRGEAP